MRKSKQNSKRFLALFLSIIMLILMMPLGSVFSFATVSAEDKKTDLAFYVPEAIYVTPYSSSWKETTYNTFQYFIENTVNTNSIYANPTVKAAKDTTGHVYFAYPTATDATLSYRYLKADGTVMATSGTPCANGTNYMTINNGSNNTVYSTSYSASSKVSMQKTSNYYYTTINAASSFSPSFGSGDTGAYIEWTVKYTDSATGTSMAAVAYTYVYKPYIVPIAATIGVRNTKGNDHDIGQITYISGVHSLYSAGEYYAKYLVGSSTGDQNYSLAPFMSSDNTPINRSNVYGTIHSDQNNTWSEKSSKATKWYSVFASTDKNYSYYYADQTNHTIGNLIANQGWVVKDAGNTFNVKSADYLWHSGDGGGAVWDDSSVSAVCDGNAMGYIYIDSSRYSNLADVPNLGVGMLVTSDKGSNSKNNLAWYIADYTGRTNTITAKNQKAKNGSVISENWNDKGTVIARIGDYGSRVTDDEGLKYAGAWDSSITKTTAEQEYKVKGAAYSCDGNAGDASVAGAIAKMKASLNDKSALRTAVQNAAKNLANLGITGNDFSSIYYNVSGSTYKNFVNYYRQALRELTKVDGGFTSALAANLTNALNALLSGTDRLSANTATANHLAVIRVLDKNGNTTSYEVSSALVSQKESKTYNYRDTLTLSSNSYLNYTCKGYAIESADNGEGSTYATDSAMVTSTDTSLSGNGYKMHQAGTDKLNFYYLAKDVTVTVDPNGGTWNNKTGNSTVTASYGSTFEPAAPTRAGYTFSGWEIKEGNGSTLTNDKRTLTCGAANVTISALWTVNSYTVSFNVNKPAQGTAPATPAAQSVTYDAAVGTLPVVSMGGYEFAGWYTAAQGGSKIVSTTPYNWIADDTTLFAHWVINGYQIIFDANGGDAIPFMQYDTENGVLPIATREGYTFKDWTVIEAAGNWTVGDTVAEEASLLGKYGNVTLRANWTANSYDVTFDLNDGNRVGDAVLENKTMTATYDSVLGTLPEPTLIGYDFAGWYTEAEGGIRVTAETVYKTAGATTYYAHWTPIVYTATFESVGGTTTSDIQYTIESTFKFPVIGKTGYTFKVWNEDGNNGNWKLDANYIEDTVSPEHMYGNVTFRAVWEANDYTVTFDLNDQTGVGFAECDSEDMIVTYDRIVGELPTPERTAYIFDGWFTQAEGGEEFTVETVYTVPNDITVYAHWTPIEYTITYDVEGGNELEPTVYTIEDDLWIKAAERAGFTFDMWVNLGGRVGTWAPNGVYTPDSLNVGRGNYGNVTLSASYSVRYYRVTWTINGVSETVEYKYNSLPTHVNPMITSDPRYTYKFVGWSPEITRVTDDIEYIAQFELTPKVYTASWKNEDGIVIHSQRLPYGSEMPTDIEVPFKDGYTGEWAPAMETMPSYNIAFTPVYTPVACPVTWMNGDDVIHTSDVKYNTIPVYDGEIPTKSADNEYYYEFSGWTPEFVPVTGPATYTATFTAIPQNYTITWIADSNTVRIDTLAFGSDISDIPTVPTKEGYVGRWLNIPETMPAEDITIVSEYRDDLRSVTWVLYEGSEYVSVVEDGSVPVYDRRTPTKPATAEYSYTFAGWSATQGGTVLSNLPPVNGADVTYYAVYSSTPNSYTVTWTADGEEVTKTTVAYGSSIELPEVPEKTGYTGEWLNVPESMPAMNITVDAVYTPVKYVITWVVGDGSIQEEWDYDSTPVFNHSTAKSSTATEDYTFVGWDKEFAVVTGDETYTAVYEASVRKYTLRFIADGSVVSVQEVAYGDAIYPIELKEKTGYTGEWSNIPAKMPASNVDIVAVYTAKLYAITWVTPKGEVVEQWAYDTLPIFGAVPAKESTAEYDYVFSGWSPAVSPVNGNARYVAQFTAENRSYTVNWVINGVTVGTQSVKYGDKLVGPAIPEMTGYDASWDTSYKTMPAQDLTVNAKYTPKNYSISWKVDGITILAETYAFGQSITPAAIPEKPGCTGTWIGLPTVMPANSITVEAVYTPNEYSVTWRAAGENGTSANAYYGTDYTFKFDLETLPSGVTIVVNNSVISSHYTYDEETGIVVIEGAAIVGDIIIVAKAGGGNVSVVVNIENGSYSNKNDVTPMGKVYHTNLYAAEGYLLPDTVVVYIDGIRLTSGYTYDKNVGKLTINGEVITGEIEINVECVADPNYVPPTKPEEPSDPGNSGGSNRGGLFGSLLDFFERIINFFRRLFGIKVTE